MKYVIIKNVLQNVGKGDWCRMQPAPIDKVLGTLAIMSCGVGEYPWIEIPDEQVEFLSAPLEYVLSDTKPAPLLDQLEVYGLFTIAERGIIFAAGQTNGIVASFLAMLRDAKDGILLDHPDFVAGVNYLGQAEALGDDALSAERIGQILSGVAP